MALERTPAPDGWEEVEQPPDIVTKYNPNEPTLFEHESGELSVHVLPEPSDLHTEGVHWRVGLVSGHNEEFEGADPIETGIESRSEALAVAEDVMETYTEELHAEDDLDALRRRFS